MVGNPGYGYGRLEVGEYVIIPWAYGPIDRRARIIGAIYQLQRRTGKRFKTEGRPSGLYIRRVK